MDNNICRISLYILIISLLFFPARLMADIEEFQVNDFYGPVYQGHSRIAVKPSGDFNIVWYDFRSGSDNDIYCQRYDFEGTQLGYNFKVNDDTVGAEQFNPDIAADDIGNFMIVWTDYREYGYPRYSDIYGRFYDYDGNPIGANIVINVNASTNKSPSVDVDGDGNFIITWYDMRYGNWDIFAQRYSSGFQPIGGNFKVNDDNGTAYQHNPRVSAADEGSFVIVWKDNRTGNDDIFAQVFDRDANPVGGNIKINSDAGDSRQDFPDIGCDPGGNFVVAWHDYRNGSYPDDADIYARKFYADGSPYGSEFRVNDDNGSANQFHPAVAVDDSANIVICWDDYRNGGYPDNPDIYFQKYLPDLTAEDSNIMLNDGGDDEPQVFPDADINGVGMYFTWTDRRNPGNDFDIYAEETDWFRIRIPMIFVTPSNLDFGLVRIGDNDTSNFTLSNIGTAGLVVDSMTMRGDPFQLLNVPAGLQLMPGYDTSFAVVFSPPDSFTYSDTIAIYSNDPENPVKTVPLSGTGYRNDFSPSPFELISPDSAEFVDDTSVTFIWNRSIDNDPGDYVRYRFVYSESGEFLDSMVINDIVDTSAVVVLSDNSIFHWRVYAYDRYGETTRCLQTGWYVNVDMLPEPPSAFGKIYPQNGSTIGDLLPTLRWHLSSDPDIGDTVRYSCFLSEDTVFSSPDIYPVGGDTTVTMTDSLQDNFEYFWKVAACDLNGDTTWADGIRWNFYTDRSQQVPDPFDLIYPTYEMVIGPGDSFIWSASIDPDPDDTIRYELWYSLDSAFYSGAVISGIRDTTYPIGNLTDNRIYYWKVKAYDTDNHYRWSNQADWRFVKNMQNDPPGPFDIITPPEGSEVGVDGVLLRWRKPVDPDPLDVLKYTVYISSGYPIDSTFLPYAVTADEMFIYRGASQCGRYYWKIVAKDSAGARSSSTDSSHFFETALANPLGFFDQIAPSDEYVLPAKTAFLTWTKPESRSDVDYLLLTSSDTNMISNAKYRELPDTLALLTFKDLPRGASVYWRIEAVAANGSLKRSNQNRWRFIIGGGSEYTHGFSLISPENRARISNVEPLFIWHRAPEINPPSFITYNLYYDTEPDFPMPSIIMNLSDTAASVVRPLQAGRSYYWKVDAFIDTILYCSNFMNYEFYIEAMIDAGGSGDLPFVDELRMPYPNPFNSSSRIEFSTSRRCRVRISIYNILGRKTAVLHDDIVEPGRHSILWSTKSSPDFDLASGIYFCVMETPYKKFVKKLVLVK
jgi:hypothetical protein